MPLLLLCTLPVVSLSNSVTNKASIRPKHTLTEKRRPFAKTVPIQFTEVRDDSGQQGVWKRKSRFGDSVGHLGNVSTYV